MLRQILGKLDKNDCTDTTSSLIHVTAVEYAVPAHDESVLTKAVPTFKEIVGKFIKNEAIAVTAFKIISGNVVKNPTIKPKA